MNTTARIIISVLAVVVFTLALGVINLAEENTKLRETVAEFNLQDRGATVDGLGSQIRPMSGEVAGRQAIVDSGATEWPLYHVVREGDWLSKMAKWYLGDPHRWPEIHELNPQIENPHHIEVGWTVRIW